MTRLGRYLNSLGFVLAGACLALPIVELRYAVQGSRIYVYWRGFEATVGGQARIQLAHSGGGGIYEETWVTPATTFAPAEYFWLPGSPLFIAAAVLILAGAIAPILASPRAQASLAGCAGLVGLAVLAAAEWQLITTLSGRSDMPPVPGYGFWIAATLLLQLGVTNWAAWHAASRDAPALVTPAVSPEAGV